MIRLHRYTTSLITLFFLCFLSRSEAQTNDSAKIQYYNNLAIDSFNQFRFDKAESYCDSALRIHENASSYFTLAYIENYKNHWPDAIKYAIRSIELDSTFLPSYAVLFNAYYDSEKWDKALSIAEKARKGDREGLVPGRIAIAATTKQFEAISNVLLWTLFSILSFFFILPAFKSVKKQKIQAPGMQPGVPFLLLLTSSVSLLFYLLFFSVSQRIWASNPKLSPSELTPFIRVFIYQHDGFESLVLYGLAFLNILLSILISRWLLRLNLSKEKFLLLAFILVLLAGYYFFQLGLSPPTAGYQKKFETSYLPLVLVFLLISWLLYFLINKSKLIAAILVVLCIAFASLIPAYSTSANDLAFLLAPALRLKTGAKFSEIYFQYDIFLSLLGLLWLKLNWALESFPYLAQLSFFLFFLGCFIFSDRFFKTKGLSAVFIIALILVRYYGVWEEQHSIFQVSPLRLDLWLILLLVAWVKGIRNWLTGLTLGLLIIFHRNLGLIYMISYLVLIFSFFVFDIVHNAQQKKLNANSIINTIIRHLRLNWINISIIVASVVICLIMSGEIFSSSALLYRKYGIGMLPISRDSFYWYVIALLSSLAILLVQYKNKLTERYFSIGLFSLALTIGNSMYFFGRSHENNIMNISGILVLCLFILFDILIFTGTRTVTKNQKLKTKVVTKPVVITKRIYLLLPFLFILITAFYYAPRIYEKLSNQTTTLQNWQFTFPLLPQPIDTATIKELTHGNDKVLFLDFYKDYYYYYYGHYKPVGLYNPISTSIFKKDVVNFLQNLLDHHYYIVANTKRFDYPYEYLPLLDYNNSAEKNDLIAISKDSVPHLLPDDNGELLHVAMKDSLANNGIYHQGLKLNKNFTIEVLIKPFGKQLPNATILSNWTNIGGFFGMTLEANDSTGSHYMFAVGTGSVSSQNVIFTLDKDQWHYLTITVSDSDLKIYDWGKQIADSKITSVIENSDDPLIIGNTKKRNAPFKGFIKEIKISNTVNEAGILEKATQLSKQMNAGSY